MNFRCNEVSAGVLEEGEKQRIVCLDLCVWAATIYGRTGPLAFAVAFDLRPAAQQQHANANHSRFHVRGTQARTKAARSP